MANKLYESLQKASTSSGVVHNTQIFECVICLSEVKKGKGVILRDCLHEFCDSCLWGHIENNMDVKICCPYADDSYSCPSFLRHNEIKGIVSSKMFNQYLNCSLNTAKLTTPNSFRCQTPGCIGWWVVEGSIKEYQCPVCKKTNCIHCEAIHEQKTCFEYMSATGKYNVTEANKMSEEAVNKLIASNKAMRCPVCKAVIEKIDGCDGLTCICKTHLCWATRGLRWGPGGRGDMSGGCHCHENNKLCDPNCRNCH